MSNVPATKSDLQHTERLLRQELESLRQELLRQDMKRLSRSSYVDCALMVFAIMFMFFWLFRLSGIA